MKRFIAATVLLLAGICLGEPATQPAGAATQPALAVASASTEGNYPTPAELIKRMKALSEKQAKASKVAFFDLSHPVAEAPAAFSLFGDDALTVRSLVDRLRAARDDKNVRGVLITLGEHGLNLAQAQEIREALNGVRHAGKPTFVYADSYDTVGYTLATGATNICLLEGGELMIPGVGMETMFYKGLFDKVGVKADYVQIGEYKGADESYTRTGASDALKGELNRLTDALYNQIVDGIASNRNMPHDAVKQMIDETILSASVAKERGFVDHVVDEDGLRDLLKKELHNDIDLLHDYGQTPREAIDMSSPLAIFQLFNRRPQASENPAIALVYAQGVISDGEAADGLFSEGGIGGETIRKAMRSAARDENVKAVVIRIDSPGGSALASEVMWQAARHVAEKKPVIISVGSMAASGGYYLASAGDHIFADPSAIVGSIGVVGGKFAMHDLYDKLGITTEEFKKGENAGLFSSNEPFTDRQRTLVTNWMHGTYVQFTQRVMKTRSGKIKDIDKVARGRIFLAGQARDLGMVDEIGGLNDALAYAAKATGLQQGKYDVRILPQPKTLADMFGFGGGPEAATPIRPRIQISADSLLGVLSPTARHLLGEQLQAIRLLQDHPVLLITPFAVSIH